MSDSPPPNGDAGPDATPDAPPTDDGGVSDAAPDASDAGACDLDAQFQSPTAVSGLSGLDSVARFSSDELTAYFALATDGGLDQLYQATRATIGDKFSAPTVLKNVNDAVGESTPWVDSKGTTIFYGHNEGNGATLHDIYYATRSDTKADFQIPQAVAIVNSSDEDDYPSLAANGDLWFASRRDAGFSMIYSAQSIGGNGFAQPQIATELNSLTESNILPLLTPDRLHIYFQRGMSLTVWMASRAVPSGPFDTPQIVNELTVDGTAMRPAWISPDGCRMYLGQGQPVTMLVAYRPQK